jgi:hypothetical protein
MPSDLSCRGRVRHQDMHKGIQDALGQNYGVPDDIDEEELLDELDALEADMALEAETAIPGEVPSYLQVHSPVSLKQTESKGI